MRWVEDQWGDSENYNTKRSKFWSYTKELLYELNLISERNVHWSNLVVWSNLYKIAPSTGGNPSNKLITWQHEKCRDLLLQEISEIKTPRILFMTGLEWAYSFLPPVTNAYFASHWNNNVHLIADAELNGINRRIVVSSRPERRQKSEWVNDVTDAFKNNIS